LRTFVRASKKWWEKRGGEKKEGGGGKRGEVQGWHEGFATYLRRTAAYLRSLRFAPSMIKKERKKRKRKKKEKKEEFIVPTGRLPEGWTVSPESLCRNILCRGGGRREGIEAGGDVTNFFYFGLSG